MARKAILALLAGLAAVWVAPAMAKKGEVERPLERAVEDSGTERPPPQRFALPGGELRVSPSTLLAARAGQRIRFSLELERSIPGGALSVRLPRRWVEVPASGIRATRSPKLRRSAGRRARVRRSDRTVELTLERAPAGETASFEIEDAGIPAGSYRLPFAWRDRNGRRLKAGSAKVVFFAPVREGPGGEKAGRLANPGLAVNVSGDTTEESETFIAATEGDNQRVAVGSNWSSASMPAWISQDGAHTWTQRTMPQTIDKPGSTSNESGSVCCDPMLAADTLGNIWYGGLTFTKGSAASRIVVNRIAAGSTSFRSVTTGIPVRTSGQQDKPMMTIDNTPTSPTFGRLYVIWDEPASGGVNIVMSQCDTRAGAISQPDRCDNADNWSTPISVTPSTGSYIYADVAVGPDGRAYVVWWDYSNVNAIRGDVCNPSSQNCAAAAGWGTPSTIATLDATGGKPVPFACPILAQPGGRASTSPQVDVDHSGGANDDRVYVTWSDLRPGSGTTRCADTLAPAATHLTFDSFVASAASGALPGSANPSASVATRLITDGEGGAQSNSDDWFAWLAVDQTDGQAWADLYSTRDDSTRRKTNFYARSVTPSGGSHTLGTLTKVSSAQSNYSTNPCCSFGNDYGDYTGIAATGGIAYPVWTDNSTGDGDPFTFTTPPSGTPPTVTTGNASSVGQSSATLNGTVNPNGQSTTYHFEYGTTTGYGTSTASTSAGSGNSASAASANVSGLTAGTTYHFRLVATSVAGTSFGGDQTFTTASPTPASAPPTVATGGASLVSQSSATVSGTVNPNGQATTWRFQYGRTSSYGSNTSPASAGAGTSSQTVASSLQFLAPGTVYHYRLVATNTAEKTSFGADRSFKTSSVFTPPTTTPTTTPADTTAPVLKVSRRRVRLGRHRRLRVRVKCGASEPEACRGALRLYTGRRRLKVAAARFAIQPGKTARVRLRLSRRGARLLERHGGLRVLAIARARDAAGNVGVKRARFTLLPPRS